MVGFTAWSSKREPTQVFILLETLYNNFDIIANKLDVFKVETIGDCYVAATGLVRIVVIWFQIAKDFPSFVIYFFNIPQTLILFYITHSIFVWNDKQPKAQPDHAVLMTKFARKCLVKLKGLVHQLEIELG